MKILVGAFLWNITPIPGSDPNSIQLRIRVITHLGRINVTIQMFHGQGLDLPGNSCNVTIAEAELGD